MPNSERGLSLVEILVVITIFSVVGILIARSVFLTLKGTSKSEASIRVRENLDYAVGVIERQIRSSDKIVGCSADSLTVNYNDYDGKATYFSCTLGADSKIASGSATARLTSTDIVITACSFTCAAASGNTSPSVTVNLTGKDATKTGAEGAEVSVSTTVFQRNY